MTLRPWRNIFCLLLTKEVPSSETTVEAEVESGLEQIEDRRAAKKRRKAYDNMATTALIAKVQDPGCIQIEQERTDSIVECVLCSQT